MNMFDDFDMQIGVEEITREDLDCEGVYDYIQNEPDNESVSRFINYANRMGKYGYMNFDY